MGLFLFAPIFMLVALLILCDDGGPVFFRQVRVGRHGTPFRIHKFRTMGVRGEQQGPQITIGSRDSRVTRIGFYLRKFKIDELPQFLDILAGTMSFVGPRPEVPRYVELYTHAQREVLNVSPGITDLASIAYRNENDILAASQDPETTYVNEVMPAKIALNLQYIATRSLWKDILLIIQTLKAVALPGASRPQ